MAMFILLGMAFVLRLPRPRLEIKNMSALKKTQISKSKKKNFSSFKYKEAFKQLNLTELINWTITLVLPLSLMTVLAQALWLFYLLQVFLESATFPVLHRRLGESASPLELAHLAYCPS
jgi:small-conductance mechanosensitive channel